MRCLLLLSGGLDSMLAGCLMKEQGIGVVAVTFTSPFFAETRGVAVARMLGLEHRVLDVSDTIIELVRHPVHGYGKHMNPCIDCHAMMVRTAARLLAAEGASFVATGEVLGERPKSQNLTALRIVEQEGNMEGLVLRPLSARLLPETVPERLGWIDRERLCDFSGRTRTRQFELADRFGIRDYATPSGGCRLTDPAFTARLKVLLERHPEADEGAYRLLSLGRHAWRGDALIVVGRNRAENGAIEAHEVPGDVAVRLSSNLGPTTLVRWADKESLELAATMTARYSQERDEERVHLVARTVALPPATHDVRELVSTRHREVRDFQLVDG